MNRILLRALGLAQTVMTGAREEGGDIVATVRPRKRCQRRCPHCGRSCDFYDMANRGVPRRWRAMDVAQSRLDVLDLFFGQLTEEQRLAVDVVTADGAKWIRELATERCPNARWVMDPFHVVQWMNDALDAVRRGKWNTARSALRAARDGDGADPGEVCRLEALVKGTKGSRYTLVKNPEDLTGSQRASSRRSRPPPAPGCFPHGSSRRTCAPCSLRTADPRRRPCG